MNRVSFLSVALVTLVGALMLVLAAPAAAQNPSGSATPENWTPERLPDGQPNITGMWNNSNAMFTPLQLPEELVWQEFSADELQDRIYLLTSKEAGHDY